MDELDFKGILKEAVNSTISNSIDNSNLYRTLFLEFSKSCSDIVEKLKQENKIIVEALKDVALTFGIDHQNIWDVEHAVTTLKREIVKRSETDRPKQRYFTYGYLGEYSHKYSVVTSKDFKYVEELDYIYEDVCYSFYFREDHKIVNAMVDKLKCDIDELLGLSDDDLMNKVQEFFKVIITEDTISREEFSEYLECCLRKAEGAGRGLTTEWIAI